MNRKRFLVASLAALALGFGINSADAQGVNDNISANSHAELVSASPYSASDVMFRHSEALAEEFPNSTSMRHSEGDSPKNLILTDPSHSFRMTGNGSPTGFAAEIPEGWTKATEKMTNPNTNIDKIIFEDFSIESSGDLAGGAITAGNGNKIDAIAIFSNNVLHSTDNRARGAAIYTLTWNTNPKFGSIIADFTNNKIISDSGVVEGGAILFNFSSGANSINGNFKNNLAITNGHAFYARGGAIGTYGKINEINGNFDGNQVIALNQNSTSARAWGGAIWSYSYGIDNISGNFTANTVNTNMGTAYGGAIFTEGTAHINTINGNFVGNKANSQDGIAKGGAIFFDDNTSVTSIKGSFLNNSAKGNTIAMGGAIYAHKDLNIIADNAQSTISGNYVQVGDGEKQYEAIYVDNANVTLTFDAKNNGKFVIDDYTNGTEGYNVKFTGDDTGTVNYNNTFKGSPNLTIENTNFNWNLVNETAETVNLSSFTMNSNVDFKADVDLVNEQMDHIETGNNYTIADGAKLTVSGMNLLNDAEKDSTKIFFAEEGLAKNVNSTVPSTMLTPIYKYHIKYIVDESDNKGYFTFARGASVGGSDGYNPSVLASPVATQAAAQVTMEHTFNYSFSNSDTFMLLPKKERIAIRNRNKYAIAENELPDGANPLYQMQDTSSAWFKPYASFENVPLKNGPKVNVISYGALAGYDTDLKELKRGWARAWTGFVGYNGANLNYNGVKTTQNGGILGGTLTMYKGNFFNATTLSAGATVGENSTMYGHDTTTSLLAGIGNKTGYNLEFIDGKFIVQPSLFLGYTFVKTFDYTNAAGVRIDSDPSHTMQISPGLKFIGNLKHGWQPYIGVNMVWNVLNNSHVKANSVTLPQMSVKPYIQYGIGLQKTVKDNFVAYGQAMVQNGGRNGISLTAGFRWAIGKNHKPIEKVQNNSSDKKVMKSATENKNQKIANNINPKMSKVQGFFAKMNGEPIAQTMITPTKAIISKL